MDFTWTSYYCGIGQMVRPRCGLNKVWKEFPNVGKQHLTTCQYNRYYKMRAVNFAIRQIHLQILALLCISCVILSQLTSLSISSLIGKVGMMESTL